MRARRQVRVMFGLAGLLAAAVAVPSYQAAAAAPDYKLQVTPEVTTVLSGGGQQVLTARLDVDATAPVTVDFEVKGGTAVPSISPQNCQVTAGTRTCDVTVAAVDEGVAEIRAWIRGTTKDSTEARLANDSSGGLLGGGLLGGSFAADCQPEDSPGLLGLDNTCNPEGTPVGVGATPEPDATDVVQVTWSEFADARLDCDDAKPGDGEDVEYNNAGVPGSRSETYTCRLTKVGSGQPVIGAYIDAEKLSGAALTAANASGADVNDAGPTDANGRAAVTLSLPEGATGAATVCFWAEPDNDAADPADLAGQNATYDPAGLPTDGSGCSNEAVNEAEGNDLADTVVLDVDNPRPVALDGGPEYQTAASGSKFSFVAVVYDQFSQVFRNGNAVVNAEYFAGSKLDTDGNNPATPDASCQTNGTGTCLVTTAAQSGLGPNTACLWVGPAPTTMIGISGDHGECDGDVPTDPTADGEGNTVPFPITDARDVIRFAVQSRPLVSAVKPEEKRADTTDLLRVSGVNFIDGARITVSGSGVTVGPPRFVSSSSLEADLRVGADAPPGPRDVIVTNLDGGTTMCRACFKVIGQGYWMVAADGGVFAFGDAPFAGSTGDRVLNQPIVAKASTPSGKGYWMVARDGGIFAFGDAPFVGSAGAVPLAKPIVGMAAHPSGRGYWLVAEDGGIFAYGDSRFYGSTGRLALAKPIVGMAAHPSGRGYWLVASDGGVFSFGDAKFFGSTGDVNLNSPIVAVASTPSGKGYWMVARDGGIFSFGDARFFGSTGAIRLNQPVVGMTPTFTGAGYWLVARDGGIFSFGDAAFHGSTGNIKLNSPIVAIARR